MGKSWLYISKYQKTYNETAGFWQKKEGKESWAGHLHNQDTVKIQPHKIIMQWVDTIELHGSKVLVHRKFAGYNFAFYFEVTEGKQIIVHIDDSRVNKKV